ncbi:MAG: hypothetical protein SFW63_06975 [Alphaproteobacteria bacterium]|nr:hypothetical protein [Alphaproteobacteria bacterium]
MMTQLATSPTSQASAESARKEAPTDTIAASDKPLDTSRKTTGERAYDVVQFLTGKVFILAATAVLAFKADPVHGGDKILGMPNFLKSFQQWLTRSFKPLAESGKAGEIVSKAAASTMILSWGGNFFMPIIKWLENGRESIANFFNRTIGKPGEEEIAHERLKDLPKQNWYDVIKGRVMAWLTVFSALTAADSIADKDASGRSYFAKYEDGFSRKLVCSLPGVGQEAKQIAALPLSEKIPAHLEKNGVYRFGKVAALDLFATSAAIIVWNTISRFSAKKRMDKMHASHASSEPKTNEAPQNAILNDSCEPAPKRPFSSAINRDDASFAGRIQQQGAVAASLSHAL